MRAIGKIFLFLAIALILLHSFLPHHHSEEVLTKQHFTACQHTTNSWVDYIAIAFHLNPGENHLEEFDRGSSISYQAFDLPVSFFETKPILAIVLEFGSKESVAVSSHQFLSSAFSFRGPPQRI